MLGFLGTISLWTALFFACLQSLLPLIGYTMRNRYLLAFARASSFGQSFFVICAYATLTYAFYTNDFSLAYVGSNSHPTLPLMYQLTAVWGGHEGSILLWVLILCLWTLVFSFVRLWDESYKNLVIALLGSINLFFLIFLLLLSNPFAAANSYLSGSDLNPLLQDVGFISHPPMLYVGYVGFATAFAITLAAIIRGRLDSEWARLTRYFALAAWCFLTIGITLGSWWAYRVLGWGGFWFWDPVENVSLLPWLSGLALIHVLVLTEKRGIAIKWSTLLALITFALSILGTFLVRSGVLVSSHTFASDPARGIFLLGFFAFYMLVVLGIYLRQFTKENISITKGSTLFFGREMMLYLNSLLLIVAMLTVLLGTLYPLIMDALHLGSISVGAPYFNLVMLPIVTTVLIFMGLAPWTKWDNLPTKTRLLKLTQHWLICVVCTGIFLRVFAHTIHLPLLLGISLCLWILISTLPYRKIFPTMSCAHMGFAILVIGILLSSFLSQEREVIVSPGDSVSLGAYQFLFMDTAGLQGPNYRGVRAAFEVTKKDHHVTNLYPEKRIYTVRDMVMTKVEIHPGIFRDLYIALGEPLDHNRWSVRLYYKPFVRWIWVGGLIMVIGGFLTLARTLRLKYA